MTPTPFRKLALGLPEVRESSHVGHPDFRVRKRIFETLVHPPLMSPDHGTPGNGLLLFLLADDFDLALRRAHTLVTRCEEEPHVNPSTHAREFSLRYPDGYYVTISALSAA